MTRLANQEKAGYFPLPSNVGEQLAAYFHAPDGGRIYDPCAGCGRALAQLAVAHNLEPYGVELDTLRANEANGVIQTMMTNRPTAEIYPAEKRLLQGTFRSVKTTKGGFNLLYVNPPYLFSDEIDPTQKEFGRDEYLWLQETRSYLQPGGLFIWVVPQHMLLHNKSVRYLSAWFSDIQVYRFPDPEYARFRQVVVFGILRPRKLTPDPDEILGLRELGRIGAQLTPLTRPEQPLYTLPPLAVPPAQFTFRSIIVDPQEAMAEAARQGVVTGEEFALHMQATANESHQLRPLTPMKKGHLVSVIAAGLLNGTVLDDGRERLMIKGQAYKTMVVTEKTEKTEEGSTTTTMRTEKVVTRITALTEQGELLELTGEALNQFLTRWLDTLTQKVVADYPPRYQFDLNGYGPIIRHLNPYRQIPRVGKTGLLPAQAHAAAAAAMRLEQENDAYIIGEMGSGKSLMGAAVPAVLHAKSRGKQMNHILVMCPPHLVKKWGREIKHVWPAVKTTVLKTISDVDRFFAEPGPIIGIMKETAGRMATGWTHAYDACGPTIAKQRHSKQKVERLQQSVFWQSARWLKEHKGIDIPEAKLEMYRQLRGVCCPTCGHRPEINGMTLMATDFTRKQLTCDNCHTPLYQMVRRNGDSNQLPGGRFQTYVQREQARPSDPPENEGYARFPLATYINQKYAGRLDLAVIDEMHQFKGADSDRGYAYHRLCTAAKKVLGLTGTLYGGRASTLFYLLYRSSSKIRKHFTDTAASGKRRMQWKKWVSNYGILQEIEVNHFDENGQSSGDSKTNIRVKELPGGSPALLPWILESCVFVSLPDLGFALPDYEEIPVLVEMSEAQKRQYQTFEKTLKEALAKRLRVRDKSLLGAYVQSLLTLPDSPWRNKGVFDKEGRRVAFAKALPDTILYPKEEAIIELIQERVAQGEKVLLLCQQTSTLDITPHWMQMLEDCGLKAAVLKAAPDKREAWIKKQLKAGLDVLITHPKRVETGLDLPSDADHHLDGHGV